MESGRAEPWVFPGAIRSFKSLESFCIGKRMRMVFMNLKSGAPTLARAPIQSKSADLENEDRRVSKASDEGEAQHFSSRIFCGWKGKRDIAAWMMTRPRIERVPHIWTGDEWKVDAPTPRVLLHLLLSLNSLHINVFGLRRAREEERKALLILG
jgi:hypothetical protein